MEEVLQIHPHQGEVKNELFHLMGKNTIIYQSLKKALQLQNSAIHRLKLSQVCYNQQRLKLQTTLLNKITDMETDIYLTTL